MRLDTPLNPTASITSDEALGGAWDVIVIGAGPAGSVATRQLASQGMATLLVERHSWPRQKVCGGCLGGRAVSVLQAIGLEAVINDSRIVPLKSLTVHAGRRSASVPLPGGVAIERSAFDATLVNAAVAAGAKFLPATIALVEPDTGLPDVRRVLLSSRECSSGLATARIVVVADGLGHPSLKQLPEFASRVAVGARVGLSLTIDRMPESYRPGVVYMAVSPDGYVGMVRTAGGRGNLAAAIDAASLRASPNPEHAAAAILNDAGLQLPDFSTAERWHGTLPLTRHTNRLAAERIVLLGDAAGYVEPFTGEGIGWALTAAAVAAPCIARNFDRWDAGSIRKWENSRRRQLARGQAVCRLLSGLLRKPFAVQMAIRALALAPSLARPIVRRVCRPLPDSKLHFV